MTGPIPSPRPPENPPDRTQSGEFRAVVEPMLKEHDNKLTVRSVVVAIAAVAMGTFTAVTFVHNRVAAQGDAGVRVQAAEAKADEARVPTMEQRLDRVDDKLDLLLDAARVPAWKRPPPRDGGEP